MLDPESSSGHLYMLLGGKAFDGPCRVSAVDSVFLNMPNLHFLPCNAVTSKVCSCFPCALGTAPDQHCYRLQLSCRVAPYAPLEASARLLQHYWRRVLCDQEDVGEDPSVYVATRRSILLCALAV